MVLLALIKQIEMQCPLLEYLPASVILQILQLEVLEAYIKEQVT